MLAPQGLDRASGVNLCLGDSPMKTKPDFKFGDRVVSIRDDQKQGVASK
jgi:hypothetical protein